MPMSTRRPQHEGTARHNGPRSECHGRIDRLVLPDKHFVGVSVYRILDEQPDKMTELLLDWFAADPA